MVSELFIATKNFKAHILILFFVSQGQCSVSTVGREKVYLPAEEIKVGERPLTAAGGLAELRSLPSRGLSARQIKDTSYFMSLLKTKEAAIAGEIDIFQEKIRQAEKESKSQKEAEILDEKLVEDIIELEGVLSDLNLTTDKLRQGADSEEMFEYQQQLKHSNECKAEDLDQIFIAKQSNQIEINQLENQVKNIHHSIQDHLQNANEIQTALYTDLTNTLQDLHEERKMNEKHIEKSQKKLMHLQSHHHSETSTAKKYKSEEREVVKLEKQLKIIVEDLKIAQMDPKEAHSFLLERVKIDKGSIDDIEIEISQLKKQYQDLKTEKKDIERMMKAKEEPTSITDDVVVYERMLRELSEVDEFLVQDQNILKEIRSDHKNKQSNVVDTLVGISESLQLKSKDLPSKSALDGLKEEASFKAKHLANSEITMKRLIDQKQKRTQEVRYSNLFSISFNAWFFKGMFVAFFDLGQLQKIENLDMKINREQEQLVKDMHQMKDDIERYSNLNQLQDTADSTKDYLLQMKERYTKRMSFMKEKVKELCSELEKNEKELKQSDCWKSLIDCEEKISRQGEGVFSLQESVNDKVRRTDYNGTKETCLKIVLALSER